MEPFEPNLETVQVVMSRHDVDEATARRVIYHGLCLVWCDGYGWWTGRQLVDESVRRAKLPDIYPIPRGCPKCYCFAPKVYPPFYGEDVENHCAGCGHVYLMMDAVEVIG